MLVLAYLFCQYAEFFLGRKRLWGFASLLDLDDEANLPAMFSTLLLLASTVLLALIARQTQNTGGRFLWHWAALAVLFAFLSVDEATSLHERMKPPLRALFHIQEMGPLWFAWVIPYGAAVIALAIIYLRFVLHLAPPIRTRVLAAGALYVGGALGMEILAADRWAAHGDDLIYNFFYVTAEETLEMAGLVIFIGALLRLLAASSEKTRLDFR